MDVNKLLENFLGSQTGGKIASRAQSPAGLLSGFGGGAGVGGLAALVLGTKKGRKLGAKALKLGGIAVVGGLAYKAYSNWQAKNAAGAQAPAAQPQDFQIEADHDTSGEDLRLGLIRAMIAAAQCDGHIDSEEHRNIRAQVDALELGVEEKAALYGYFSEPATAQQIAALARTEAQKAEIYLASALCIDPDTPEEQTYLKTLATHMQLPEGLRDYLDAEANAAKESAQQS